MNQNLLIFQPKIIIKKCIFVVVPFIYAENNIKNIKNKIVSKCITVRIWTENIFKNNLSTNLSTFVGDSYSSFGTDATRLNIQSNTEGVRPRLCPLDEFSINTQTFQQHHNTDPLFNRASVLQRHST